jgi:hypothetical protein
LIEFTGNVSVKKIGRAGDDKEQCRDVIVPAYMPSHIGKYLRIKDDPKHHRSDEEADKSEDIWDIEQK